MIPILVSKSSANGRSRPRSALTFITLLPLVVCVIACVLTCVSCTDETSSTLVDVTPLGDGLRVLAYAILGVGVLGVLGKLVK